MEIIKKQLQFLCATTTVSIRRLESVNIMQNPWDTVSNLQIHQELWETSLFINLAPVIDRHLNRISEDNFTWFVVKWCIVMWSTLRWLIVFVILEVIQEMEVGAYRRLKKTTTTTNLNEVTVYTAAAAVQIACGLLVHYICRISSLWDNCVEMKTSDLMLDYSSSCGHVRRVQ